MAKAKDGRPQVPLTKHAWCRMHARGVSEEMLAAVFEYGRVVHVRGARIHALGRKEVQRALRFGVDLSDSEGLQVVCSHDGTSVLTVYRNHDFRGLRPRSRPRRPRRR